MNIYFCIIILLLVWIYSLVHSCGDGRHCWWLASWFFFLSSVLWERGNGTQVVFRDLVSKNASFSCEHFRVPCVTAQIKSNISFVLFINAFSFVNTNCSWSCKGVIYSYLHLRAGRILCSPSLHEYNYRPLALLFHSDASMLMQKQKKKIQKIFSSNRLGDGRRL